MSSEQTLPENIRHALYAPSQVLRWPRGQGHQQLVVRTQQARLTHEARHDDASKGGTTDYETRVDFQDATPSPFQTIDPTNVNPFASMPVELPAQTLALLMEQSTSPPTTGHAQC